MTSDWRKAIFSRRIWPVALAVVAMPLFAEFNARLAVSRQLFEEEARLQREIAVEQARSAFLQAYEQHLQTDAYVEWWARVSARMSRPGEIAVVPQLPTDPALAVAPSAASNLPRDTASEWWAAFFASVP